MPAYNFKPRFAELVRAGRKRQTIRALRKDGREPRVGETFVAYIGMRTKTCQRLHTGRITQVRRIRWPGRGVIYVDECCLTSHSAAEIAAADGFFHVFEFIDFFEQTHGFPFEGHIINWA
jgi:hypothetical protein